MNMGVGEKELWKSNKRHVQRWEKAKESMAGGWIFQICPVRRVAHVTDNTPHACDATLFRQESSSLLHFIYHSTQPASAAARTLTSHRSEQYCTSSVTAATRLLNLARLAALI